MTEESKCPVAGRRRRREAPIAQTATGGRTISTSASLHANSTLSDPMDEDFDYAKEFQSLDLDAVVKDLTALMTEFAGLVAG